MTLVEILQGLARLETVAPVRGRPVEFIYLTLEVRGSGELTAGLVPPKHPEGMRKEDYLIQYLSVQREAIARFATTEQLERLLSGEESPAWQFRDEIDDAT